MRIAVAVVLSLIAANLYAGKPTNPEPESSEPVFVGYSTGTFSTNDIIFAWVEGSDLCRATFGEGAFHADAGHINQAIKSGTFFWPTADSAAFLPLDTYPGKPGNWIRITTTHSTGPYIQQHATGSGISVLTVAACAQ